MKVTIRPVKVRGEARWCVDVQTPIKRTRSFYLSKRSAESAAVDARKEIAELGVGWAELSARDRQELTQVHREATAAGVSVAQVWQEWQQGRRAEVPGRVSLAKAISETVAAKLRAKRRVRYVDELETYLRAFAAGREGVAVGSITPQDVERWLQERGGVAATRASNLGRLSALFGYCERMGYVRVNVCRRVERPTIEAKPPQILSVAQCGLLLETVRREMPRGLAWFSLALLAGIRPEECDRLGWEAVDLKQGVVTVAAAASKVRQRRLVHLLPNAVAWLEEAQEVGSVMPLAMVTRRRYLRALRPVLRFTTWPQDILRHTAASYWIAHRQDAGAVAHELGNSAGVLLRVYRELVTRQEAEAWVNLRPTMVTKPKEHGKNQKEPHDSAANLPPLHPRREDGKAVEHLPADRSPGFLRGRANELSAGQMVCQATGGSVAKPHGQTDALK